MTDTPETRLSLLIDLSARLGDLAALSHNVIPEPVLTDVGKALGEQMRAVAAELGKGPPAPVAPREFKVGDRVRVVSNDDRLSRNWGSRPLGEGRIINSDIMCWKVLSDDDGEFAFHSAHELELIEG